MRAGLTVSLSGHLHILSIPLQSPDPRSRNCATRGSAYQLYVKAARRRRETKFDIKEKVSMMTVHFSGVIICCSLSIVSLLLRSPSLIGESLGLQAVTLFDAESKTFSLQPKTPCPIAQYPTPAAADDRETRDATFSGAPIGVCGQL